MKQLLFLVIFLGVFGLTLYFFILNSSTKVKVVLWNGLVTPEIPLGMAILFAFYIGFILGILFSLLTFVIKRLS